MPFVLVALGDMAWCVVAVLLAIAIGLFTDVIVHLIPNVPLIGSAIRDGVQSAGGATSSWLIGQTKSQWTRIGHLFTDLGYADKWLWTRINGAVLHGFQQIDNVVLNVIPGAVNHIAQSLQNNIDTVTTDLRNDWSSLVNDRIPAAIGAAETYTDNHVGALANTVSSDVDNIYTNLHTAETSLQNNIDSLARDTATELTGVWNAIDPLQTAVAVTIPAAIGAEAAKEVADNAATLATAHAQLVTATNNLQDNLNTVEGQLSSALASGLAAAAAISAADLSTAEGAAQADAAAAQLAASNAAATALTATKLQLQGAIDTNTQRIDQLSATQTLTLPALGTQTIGQTITIPLAVGALAASVASIISEIDECMVTSCEGPNNWQNLLQKALGVADFAALAVFLGEAIRNPKATADTFAGVGESIWDAGHSLIDDLLSL